jgi:hypothetical protein
VKNVQNPMLSVKGGQIRMLHDHDVGKVGLDDRMKTSWGGGGRVGGYS